MDAINTGKFKGQIVPIEQKTKSGPVYFITDERLRLKRRFYETQEISKRQLATSQAWK
jgi:hypothetical protein